MTIFGNYCYFAILPFIMSSPNFNLLDHKITGVLKAVRNQLTIIRTEVDKIVNEAKLRVEAFELALDNRGKETLLHRRELTRTLLSELALSANELGKQIKIHGTQISSRNSLGADG